MKRVPVRCTLAKARQKGFASSGFLSIESHVVQTQLAVRVYADQAAQSPSLGVQSFIPEIHIHSEAAGLMRWRACELFDAHRPCGAETNRSEGQGLSIQRADKLVDTGRAVGTRSIGAGPDRRTRITCRRRSRPHLAAAFLLDRS